MPSRKDAPKDAPATEAEVYGERQDADNYDKSEWQDDNGVTRQTRPPTPTVGRGDPVVGLIWKGEKRSGRRALQRVHFGNTFTVIAPSRRIHEERKAAAGPEATKEDKYLAEWHDEGRTYVMHRGVPFQAHAEDVEFLTHHPQLDIVPVDAPKQ